MGDRTGRRSRRTVVIAVVVAAVLAAAGVGAYAATSSRAPRYRTATVSAEAVAQTLTEVGTASPVSSRTLAFPIAGTVAEVAVRPGDQVTAGQTLASLDPTTLDGTLAVAHATLAEDQLTLEQDETGQSSSRSAATPAEPDAATSAFTGTAVGSTLSTLMSARFVLAAAPGGESTSGGGSSSGVLDDAQHAVTDAQHIVDSDLAAAAHALDAAKSTCATVTTPSASPVPTPTPSAAASRSAGEPTPSAGAIPSRGRTPTLTTSVGTGSTSSSNSACLTAEQTVLQMQSTTASDESAVLRAEQALTTLLPSTATTSAGSGTAGPTGAGAASTGSGAQASSGSRSSTAGSGAAAATTKRASAADLAADQAAIDAANAKLAVAQQGLQQATLVAETSGTVLSVTIVMGSALPANSSTAVIRIAGSNAYTFGVAVPVAGLSELKVGDVTRVVPDGAPHAVTGRVVRIGVAPTTTTGSSYLVTIGLTGAVAGVRDGSSGSVTITTASVASRVSVPTSALSLAGSTYAVRVLDRGAVRRVQVRVGASGTARTQILSGLKAGEQVVLADLHQSLPSANTALTNRQPGLGGGAGFGGGTGLGGGFGNGRQ